MGRIIVVGYGVDPHFVARAVDELGLLGHSVEVVTSVDKARELVEASQPAPVGPNPEIERLVAQMHRIIGDSEWERERDGLGIRAANSLPAFQEEKPLQRRHGPVYGSKRSRAGRAARWG